ncbi:hypothetical protein [Hansschlegelia zhihuaiae]|uniref:Guanylate cyclase domain-containing protein n=1 Tax=Hansschlegelia zhihuaiae TaxID=405005 RepID=A0A4Q0M9S7_9HYPH|nr:hypothetical protein [Hansschlegelia zhihuaiae]RXF69904.1 hypothetical protein EK403_18185 [Hansschlegelia zhihuaiae]
MSDRVFLYIDILGFKDMVVSGKDIKGLYKNIDELNVHTDRDFRCIVFSDTIIVYGSEFWLDNINSAVMWLAEFAQDLFYRIITSDIHFRAYITVGEFEHFEMKNLDAYYGEALIRCYEIEKTIKSTGVFLDAALSEHSDVFNLTKFDDNSYYMHIMQTLNSISFNYEDYPIHAEHVTGPGIEGWLVYELTYLSRVFRYSNDQSLQEQVRVKHANAWKMISYRHPGLTKKLIETDFDFSHIVPIDWTELIANMGTPEGAWG